LNRQLEMNAPIEFEVAQHHLPAQFRSLLKAPRLLPGENRSEYEMTRHG